MDYSVRCQLKIQVNVTITVSFKHQSSINVISYTVQRHEEKSVITAQIKEYDNGYNREVNEILHVVYSDTALSSI